MSDADDSIPAALIGFMALVVGLVTSVAVLGYQVIRYLSNGIWPALSLLDPLLWVGVSWASWPTGWVGVHRILVAMPLALGCFVIGYVLFIVLGYLGGLVDKPRSTKSI